ncbi:chaperonin [Thecamonas trahens ATCC 50062]|uniref:Chaperonin n=1 Tax=Thecamonas trahens ATCC 50062 TaxID=461836 RepID=A0A0L0DAA6_THETB|nr:chaperonin [Thecamonas trahens ATCC 50062]KNC49289.1 chaperonin [Thecamonas trahens ATCC 50062]|eukprot:XP_013758002.1 chaperonin [Thecamonas trahens ATCC 50062]
MVVNHLGKLFVTSDTSSILQEIDVQHPAAKMIMQAMFMQEAECGDGTNYVIVFAGELLAKAELLLKMGVHTVDVVLGFNMALAKALELIPELVVDFPVDLHSADSIKAAILPVIAAKQYGYEEHFAGVIAEACAAAMPEDPAQFNVDTIRVAKMVGGSTLDTAVVRGMVVGRRPESTVQSVQNARVAVFAQAIAAQTTETKGTVLMHNADELLGFSKAEEAQMERTIKGIADSGANVVLTGGKVSDIALHFLDKYNLLVVKVLSKFQLRRLCKAVGARPLVNLGVPTPDDLGFCADIHVEEVGSTYVTVFATEDSAISTILIRGSTMNLLDDVSRAVDDGVNAVKSMTKDPRFVPGAGAFEIGLAARIAEYADSHPGVEQYAIQLGPRRHRRVASLYSAQKAGKVAGVDLDSEEVMDPVANGVVDLAVNKLWALKLSVDVATTIVSVDEVVMSRQAGGPKPPQMGARDA